MKKRDVKIGATYTAKVRGFVVPVRIESESSFGGWIGTNVRTLREVHIKSAARLRREVRPDTTRKED